MSKVIGYGVLLIGLGIGVLAALSAYNESAASREYARGRAEAMIITATSQAQQASAVTMFPYFVIGLGFLGLILVLTVWVILNNRKEDRLDRQLEIMASQQVIERHYHHTSEKILIAPSSNRREFYQSLQTPQRVKVNRLGVK